MLAKTLSQYRAAVAYEASVAGAMGQGTSYRHDQDQIDAELNGTFQAFREELTSRDFPFYVEETEQDDLPSERADDNENYSLIDWPTSAHEIRRIDVYAKGQWDALQPVDWTRLRDVIPRSAQRVCRPLFYAVKKQGTPNSFEGVDGTEYEVEAGKIALAPFATAGVYKLSYLPVWTYALDDDELFVFPSEFGFRWCVWEMVRRIAIRDRNAGKRGDYAAAERTVCEQKIGRYVPRIVMTGGTTMRRSARYNG